MSIQKRFSEREEDYHFYRQRMDYLRTFNIDANYVEVLKKEKEEALRVKAQALAAKEQERAAKEMALLDKAQALADKEQERIAKEDALAQLQKAQQLLKQHGLE